MTDLQLLSAKANGVKNIMQQLSSAEFGKEADPEFLYKRFLLLQKKFGELSKLTNAGKATPELKKTKLKVIKTWLDKYSDAEVYPSSAEVAIEGLPKKYKNKNVFLNNDSLRQISYFKHYITYVLDYMEKLEPRYKAVKSWVDSLLKKSATLQSHMDKFLLTEEHLPSYDLLAADDRKQTKPPPVYQGFSGQEPEVSPTKMLATIQTILNQYHQFSLKVSQKYNEVVAIAQELEEVDLGDFFARTNRRNKLIQNLLRDLVEMNKILYQGDLPNKDALRLQYYQIVENCVETLPDHIASRLLATIKPHKTKDKMQTALEGSLEGIKKYDPRKDPAMRFQSPHFKNYIAPKEPAPFVPKSQSLEQRVDQKLRHQELKEISERQGNPVSETDKEKYEKLWTGAQAHNKISKLAKYYQSRF